MGEGSRNVRRAAVVAAVVAVTVVAVVTGVVLKGGGQKADAEVSLERADAPGADPFSTSMAVGPVVSFPANVEAISANTRKQLPTSPRSTVRVADGTAPGLYGGSGDAKVCDAARLVSFLEANPRKARAWAAVLGLQPAGIADYVGTLTPVVLTSDTLVGNHGYASGRATSVQSVLQAGTAVMVDATGLPRVKCNCGNPLTEPAPIDTRIETRGRPWAGYAPDQVVQVRPGDPVAVLQVLDIDTGDRIGRPVGSGGSTPAATTTSSPAVTTSTSPPTTTAPAPGELRKIDWKNMTYPLTCGDDTSVTLTNGSWVSADGPDMGTVTLDEVVYGDVLPLRGEEAVVNIGCGQGNSYVTMVIVYVSAMGGPALRGEPFGTTSGARIEGGRLLSDDDELGPSDPRCCPSIHVTHEWKLDGETWTSTVVA